MDEVKRLNVPGLPPPAGAYSHACIVPLGNVRLILLAGQVPVDEGGRVVGVGDVSVQTEQVFKNLGAALAQCDASFADVVKTTIFVTDASQRGEVGAVRNRLLSTALPASTLVEVSALGHPEWLVEIEAIAVTGLQSS